MRPVLVLHAYTCFLRRATHDHVCIRYEIFDRPCPYASYGLIIINFTKLLSRPSVRPSVRAASRLCRLKRVYMYHTRNMVYTIYTLVPVHAYRGCPSKMSPMRYGSRDDKDSEILFGSQKRGLRMFVFKLDFYACIKKLQKKILLLF